MKQSLKYGERDYSFGQVMVTLRTAMGMTQLELATCLGISRRAVQGWEGGRSYPKTDHLKQFIELCVRHRAFPVGREVDELRTFWEAAHQKSLLDEYWLSELLARPSASPAQPAGEPSEAFAQGGAAASKALALWTVPYARNPHFTGRDELLSELMAQLSPQETGQPMALRRGSDAGAGHQGARWRRQDADRRRIRLPCS